ncbi:MAG: ArsR family transcriptional regulator [Desulfurococcales archaeon ex4484_204]|nr:MAG: ArsR family transcriptional regulator [Desulfurococcales archaeon ex4484_204]
MSSHSSCLEDIFSSRGRVKVLKTIIELEEVNISRLIKLTRLNYRTVVKHLEYLKKVGIVDEIVVSRTRIFRLNLLNPKVRLLIDLVEQLSDLR